MISVSLLSLLLLLLLAEATALAADPLLFGSIPKRDSLPVLSDFAFAFSFSYYKNKITRGKKVSIF
jgi:hypothetical protein